MTKEQKDEICYRLKILKQQVWSEYPFNASKYYYIEDTIKYIQSIPTVHQSETNLEHYYNKIVDLFDSYIRWDEISNIFNSIKSFAYVGDNEQSLWKSEKILDWLVSSYNPKIYQLNKIEYDSIYSALSSTKKWKRNSVKFKDVKILLVMKEHGYFKNVNEDIKLKELAENMENIEVI